MKRTAAMMMTTSTAMTPPMIPPVLLATNEAKNEITQVSIQIRKLIMNKNNGLFTLDVCVNVQHYVNVKRQEWVQTHSVPLCLHFH